MNHVPTWAVLALLIPFAWLAAGIVCLFSGHVGVGLSLVIEAVALVAVCVALRRDPGPDA